MRPNPSPDPASFGLSGPMLQLLAALLIAAALLVKPVVLKPPEFPAGDAPRYIAAALNLHDYGVIASAYQATRPEPGLVVGGPLIAAELALAMAIDPELRETFRCALGPNAQPDACPLELGGMIALHFAELLVFAGCVWWAAWLVFSRYSAAWLAMLLALLCREVTRDAGQALTEPLTYALLGLFSLSWIRAWQKQTALSWLVAGTASALLLLAKPAAAIIVPIALGLLLLEGLRRKLPLAGMVRNGAALICGCAAILTPWLVRNYLAIGTAALSDSSYLATTFAHRIAYNAMSWAEWLVGWIYYLPDFGDNIAARWFDAPLHARLGWDEAGYYVYGRDKLYPLAAKVAPEGTSGYLLREFVLQEPLKHVAVTMLLAWRGVFVGKLWALVMLVLLPAGIATAGRPERRMLLLLLVPAVILVFAQAFLSVSIPRYNNALVLPLALAGGGLLSSAARDFWRYGRAKASRRDR